MSKKFLRNCLSLCFFLPLVFLSPHVHAQGYNFSASSGTFTALTGATAIDDIEDDDELSAAIPIGFSFTYFGAAYTTLKVSSNGFVSFDPAATSPANSNAFPSGTILKIAAPLWDDLDGTSGTASYKLSGVAGSQVLTVEWLNWEWNFFSLAAISFQAKFYEGTNKIEFVYRQENGALTSPSASIGLVGNTAPVFYSLNNSTTSPDLSSYGFTDIDSKPATGQIYTFTTNAGATAAPTVAASSITAPLLNGASAKFSWNNGNGMYRAVFVKQTSSTSDFFSPVNGSTYYPSTEFGDEHVGSSWYCVYNGIKNSVDVTNLESTFGYRVQVVEYNMVAGIPQYNTGQVAANFITPLQAPVNPISTLTPLWVSSNKLMFDLNEGNGSKRAIFMKAGSSGTAPVVDNTTYTANSVFGSGTQIGATGWFCVFNSTSGFEQTITGLTANTTYQIYAVDYNGAAGVEKYFASTATNNPVQMTTYISVPVLPTYTFAASAGTYSPLTGGTAVDAIEADDTFSGLIPIGFTFRLGGIGFTQLKASSNGFLSFNPFVSNNSGGDNLNDLTSYMGRPLLAPLWDDLGGSGGQASYSTTGTSPNRVFTFEYLNWRWRYNASAAGISFQVKLYEANNKIEYIYRPEAGVLNAPEASIGLALPGISEGTYSFLSLNNTSTSPVMSSVTETKAISVAPASGQTYSFTPNKLNQTITFAPLSSVTYGSSSFNLTATASSGLPVTYTSSNTAVATISGNTVTIVGAGTTDITANQVGDPGYNATTGVARTLSVVKANQVITFAAISSKTSGDASFNLAATTSSGLTISYTSSNTAVATISGNTVTIVGAGNTDITASQPGNLNYNPATSVMQPLQVKSLQTITFNTLSAKTIGDASFNLTATASSGLTVSYTSSNTAVATISGSTVTIVGAGTTQVTASQSGDATYGAAADVIQPLVVKTNQTITFTTIPTKTLGDAPFALSATATSSLAVTFTTTSDKVNIAAGQVTLVKAGSVTIKADQAGNANYNAATSAERTFCVNPAKPVVTLSGLDTEAPVLTSSNTTGNQWFKEGVAISGSTGTTFSPTTPGIYTVISTVDNCSSVSSEQQAIIVTGVEDISKLITVFPNPAQKEVTIDLTSLGKEVSADVAIFDLAGRVFHSSSGKGKMTVNIASYDKGNYLVRVKAGSRVVTKQIAKN